MGGGRMQVNREEIMGTVYNLVLNPATRKWEREQLQDFRNKVEQGANLNVELSDLESKLRPLAIRDNLTPDVTDFYRQITGTEPMVEKLDIKKHDVTDPANQERAVFAGGCFWCMVEPFETRPGIISVLSGYTGGHVDHPTYDQVIGQTTGHVEAVEIIFDRTIVSYSDLVELYWQITDPTDDLGQVNDRGNEYRPVIFAQNAEQRKIAEESKVRLEQSGKYKNMIVTEIRDASKFWPAETFHQQFYKKNPKRYKRLERSRNQYLKWQQLQGNVRQLFKSK
ncbi:peptide methionine sulfoxide reductase [Pediococcus argentinicus]|uniref:Peptide methionine sulfoxide reductase MsrA n=2 Tax=Pediococcus argentinicus TaxID=480391 RepID=A0A0R2NFK4_9LACO|nr:peptide methionine sulfoxide reductase [Pediococcus argentinicus]